MFWRFLLLLHDISHFRVVLLLQYILLNLTEGLLCERQRHDVYEESELTGVVQVVTDSEAV